MSNKIQRNYPCPCGSGKKFKRCHEPTQLRERQVQRVQELARMNPVQAQQEPERKEISPEQIIATTL